MSELIREWHQSLRCAGKPDEYEVKHLLRLHHVPVPQGIRLLPEDPLLELPFPGPYVAKVCSADILHKTEEKGVLLKLDAQRLPDAVADLRRRFPGASVLIESFRAFEGLELIIGALADPSFGPAVMVGAGGVMAEVYQDVSFRLIPCTERDTRDMLSELVLAPVFSGFRGMTMDASALAALIASVGGLVEELGEHFYQLDLNPVVFAGGQWTVLDAKLLLK